MDNIVFIQTFFVLKKTYARRDATDDEVFIIQEEEEEEVVSAKGKLSKDLGRISRPRRNMN